MTDQLHRALAQLADAEERLDMFVRLGFSVELLRRGSGGSGDPAEARAFLLALHDLVNSGATISRLTHLVSVLEVSDALPAAVNIMARKAARTGPPLAEVWAAVADIAAAVEARRGDMFQRPAHGR